jgi:hypothetical protein
MAAELQLVRNVTCKWCGCRVEGDHRTIEECVRALEAEVGERRRALATGRRPRDKAQNQSADSADTSKPKPPKR